jgi:hypothetical protein
MKSSRRPTTVLLVAACVMMPALLHAQRCTGCVTGEDTIPRLHIIPALGIHAGTPQKASAAVGVGLGVEWQRDGRDHSRNVVLFAEPGLAAGRASVAYVDQGRFGSGFGIAATVLRTWDDPWVAKQNTTYVGGDILLWPIVFMGPRIGVFRRIAGDPSSNKWFISLDIGIGL